MFACLANSGTLLVFSDDESDDDDDTEEEGEQVTHTHTHTDTFGVMRTLKRVRRT